MGLDSAALPFLFVSSIALGGLIGIARGSDIAGQRLSELRQTTDWMKRRWWAVFRQMIQLAEDRDSEDQGDYWKHGRRPPWYA